MLRLDTGLVCVTNKITLALQKQMKLIGVRGSHSDYYVIDKALQNQPSLILDCANKANPHAFFPTILPEDMQTVYVMEIDLLYSFRDALKKTKQYAEELKTKTIVVTSFDHLFHYGDEEENEEIFKHAWELLSELSMHYKIYISISKKHTKLAKQYCTEVIKQDTQQQARE